MDVTAEYVKMCEKAQEIQALWKHSKRSGGDWYFHRELNCAYPVTMNDQNNKHCIWLPRQDQLQAMIEREAGETWYNTMNSFHCWASVPLENDKDFSIWRKFLTFEQLWLAFVMKEKYEKTWDGKEWKLCPTA